MHVAREQAQAKFWLDPVRLVESAGFGRAELADIERVVQQHAEALRKVWDDFFAH